MIVSLPELTRPARPSGGLTCGWDDQPTPGVTLTCGQPATVHIWITPVPPSAAVLLCDPHARAYTVMHAWHDRHPATAACAQAARTWQPGNPSHCTT